jgi:hypothetical protein
MMSRPTMLAGQSDMFFGTRWYLLYCTKVKRVNEMMGHHLMNIAFYNWHFTY